MPAIHISDRSTPNTLAAWQSAVEPATLAPVDLAATRQRSWDDPCCQRQSTLLLNSAVNDREKVRLRASLTATSGAWLQALPTSSVGAGWTTTSSGAVGLRLWRANLCEPHVHMRCPCGCPWHARVVLQEKRWTSPPPRPAQRRRARCRPARNRRDSAGQTGSVPTGSRWIPWSRGRCVTWDVTSPDTLAPSHLLSSATQAGSAAARAEAAKTPEI